MPAPAALDPSTTVVVANPAAAGGKVARDWDRHAATLRVHLGEVRLLRTERMGHATELARQAVLDGARTVLSMGGDGTHNEVVNGIMGAEPPPGEVALGLLPAGTGGDFRRLVRDNADVESAARGLAGASSAPVDVGHVRFRADSGADEERFFINIASFGIGGLVDRIVNDSSKRLGGKATFFLSTFKALLRYTPARVRLVVDGEEQGVFDITNIFVCNGRYAGGSMYFAPEARLGDGLFDIVIVREMGLLRTLTTAGRFYDGGHVDLPETTVLRGAHVVAKTLSDDPAFIDIDGEAPGGLPAEFTLRPGAIRLLHALDGVI